jgi:hypothetical protein
LGNKYYSYFKRRLTAGAPYKDAYKKFEITPEGIAKRAKVTIDFWKGTFVSF